ncbi:Aryl-alcohol oxidase [Rhizoctonia solani]|uniref:Aryl-alcohol oxidase n=1 Tax=Rhizoctonia solani TaxID=456999 RepID=A0A8H7I3W5_9AGAM|nr:Aryl-alcohol oxidase [Rhizoctonia solani]
MPPESIYSGKGSSLLAKRLASTTTYKPGAGRVSPRSRGTWTTIKMRFALAAGIGATLLRTATAALEACPNLSSAEYDYIVVGAGAGGGPLAARLAISGYKVLLMDAGHDVFNVNTTILCILHAQMRTLKWHLTMRFNTTHRARYACLYFQTLFESNYMPMCIQPQVQKWYPRAAAIGGSTVHNALIHLRNHDYDLDTLATRFKDSSWSASNMRKYLSEKIEKNQYIPSLIGKALSYGYDGWLWTDFPLSASCFHLREIYRLQQQPERWERGGAAVISTRDGNHNRSSVRDHLVNTRTKLPQKLSFATDTLATKILTCADSTGKARAYGVQAAAGQYLLPVSRQFKGKQTLATKQYTAKYEVVVSAGAFQTPQLLLLSGIGDSAQLAKFNIPTLKQNHTILNGCLFGDTFADPCLKTWAEQGHNNVYSSGPGFWAHAYKSSSDLPYLDVWSMWGPGAFKGYYKGYPLELAQNIGNTWNNVILKAHTSSKGWVPDLKDLEILKDAVKKSRELWASRGGLSGHTVEEVWPGSAVKTDDQIREFLRENTWGHHVCCTAKMGTDDDARAVLNKDFQVRGVGNLRVVDASSFPDIPGMFVTTPIYQISEKAADVMLAFAKSNKWTRLLKFPRLTLPLGLLKYSINGVTLVA